MTKLGKAIRQSIAINAKPDVDDPLEEHLAYHQSALKRAKRGLLVYSVVLVVQVADLLVDIYEADVVLSGIQVIWVFLFVWWRRKEKRNIRFHKSEIEMFKYLIEYRKTPQAEILRLIQRHADDF